MLKPAYGNILWLGAHCPLTESERTVARVLPSNRRRLLRWIALPLLLAGSGWSAVSLLHALTPDYAWLPSIAAVFVTLVTGLFFAGSYLAAAAMLAARSTDAPGPLSAYWGEELARRTARVPELEAIRQAWIRDAGSLSDDEYHLLMNAVRAVERTSTAPGA